MNTEDFNTSKVKMVCYKCNGLVTILIEENNKMICKECYYKKKE
jgi:hypothetical protein